MGALQNSFPPPDPAFGPVPPAVEPARRLQHPWQKRVLDATVELAAPPTLITVVGNFFTENTRILALCTAAGLAIAIALRFFAGFPKKGMTLLILPWILTGALALVLVFVVTPNRAKDQSKLLASSWLEWQKDLERSAEPCKKSPNLEQCLATNLSPVLERRPQPTHVSDITGLASDLLAGQLMRANDDIRKVLQIRLGIDERFIGSGFSEPVGETDFTTAQVAEYLVPNLSNSAQHLWVWKLKPGTIIDGSRIADHTLEDIFDHVQPDQGDDFEANWTWIKKDHLIPGDAHVLVRFALLDLKKRTPSGCLGRTEAIRVFMNSLGEVAKKSLTKAASSSGYTVTGTSDDPNVWLYIWVYAPTEEITAVRATWKNVLANFGNWIVSQHCTSVP